MCVCCIHTEIDILTCAVVQCTRMGRDFLATQTQEKKAKESLYRGLVVYVCPIIHINSKSANMNTSILTVFLIVCVGRSLWEAIVSSVMPPVRTH